MKGNRKASGKPGVVVVEEEGILRAQRRRVAAPLGFEGWPAGPRTPCR
jgi:hypothetical protein